MSDTDEEVDRLSDLLHAIPVEREGMTIGDFDGYVAALIVSPEMVSPSEWLPGVWGRDGVFADVAEAQTLVAAVMGHYNRVARELAEEPEDYAPVLEVDANGSELQWGPWINGFERGMRLRPDAWEAIADSDDEEAVASVSMILAMNALDCGESEFDEAAEEELDELTPELIPEFVHNLNAWTKSRAPKGGVAANSVSDSGYAAAELRPFGRKVGRNELCPCGSGRKYKRCCGAH